MVTVSKADVEMKPVTEHVSLADIMLEVTEKASEISTAGVPKGLENARSSYQTPQLVPQNDGLIATIFGKFAGKSLDEVKDILAKLGVNEDNWEEVMDRLKPEFEKAIAILKPKIEEMIGEEVSETDLKDLLSNVNPFALLNEIMDQNQQASSLMQISQMQSMELNQNETSAAMKSLQDQSSKIEKQQDKDEKRAKNKWLWIGGAIAVVVTVAVVAVAVVAAEIVTAGAATAVFGAVVVLIGAILPTVSSINNMSSSSKMTELTTQSQITGLGIQNNQQQYQAATTVLNNQQQLYQAYSSDINGNIKAAEQAYTIDMSNV